MQSHDFVAATAVVCDTRASRQLVAASRHSEFHLVTEARMISSALLQQVQATYNSWNETKASTAEPFFNLMADDVQWRSISGGAREMEFTRPHLNKAQVRNYFAELARDWRMLFYNVDSFLILGETVAAVCECAWRHVTTGKVVHSPKLDIMRFKDGKMTEFFEYFDNAQAIAACSGQAQPGTREITPYYSENRPTVVEGESEISRRNVAALKTLYEEWHSSRGKRVEAIVNLLAPNVRWGSLAAGADSIAFTKQHLSKQQVSDYFVGLANSFEMNFYEVDQLLAAGDYVLMLGKCSFRNKNTGKNFVTPKADLWRFASGQAVEFFEYYDTAAAIATTH